MADDPYTTALSPEESTGFTDWLKQLSQARGRDMSQDTSDYDMQGAYKAGVKAAANGHFDDQFKKPNHMTFSTDSQYNGKPFTGGTWEKAGNKWVFKASADNLKFHSRDELVDYFKRVEPTSTLYLPGDKTPTVDPSNPNTIITK